MSGTRVKLFALAFLAIAIATAVTSAARTAGATFAPVATGQISGKLTNAVGGAGLSGIFVSAVTASNSSAWSAQTDAGGNYTLQGLPAGTYYVEAQPYETFIQQRYPAVLCVPYCASGAGTAIVLANGGSVTAINMALGKGGKISGTVTAQSNGAPIAGVVVDIYATSGAYSGTGYTDASGVYTADRLPAGSYKARTSILEQSQPNFVDQVYNNLPCFPSCSLATAQAINVTTGATTAGINFSLSAGGTISGTVTDATTGVPLVTMVRLYNSTGVWVTQTFSDNGYAFTGLPTGSYFVRTFQTYDSPYPATLYADKPCAPGCVVTQGTSVSVVAGATTSGINLALQAGGSIGGTVTDALSGLPVSGGQVYVYSANGTFLTQSNYIEQNGAFTVIGLSPGTYYARTIWFLSHANKIYGGQDCLGNCNVLLGSPISVVAGQPSGGINFALSPAGRIAGTVKDASGNGIDNVPIEIYSAAGVFVNLTSTDLLGVFEVDGLRAGSYFARTRNRAGFIDELYDNGACVPDCTRTITAGAAIAVSAGQVTNGINFVLAAGGRVAGHVTSASSGGALDAVQINIYTSTGALAVTALTDPFGNYLTSAGLPTGTYFARTFNAAGFDDEIFNNKPFCLLSCQVTSGDPITVTAGVRTNGIDYALATSTELIRNGDFSNGTAFWSLFATPDLGYLAWQIAEPQADEDHKSEFFQYYRVAPPPGQSGSAVILQPTGAPVAADVPLLAHFDVGNSSQVRKRISVLVHEGDFSDLSVCTFWLEANTPATTYAMRTRTSKPWTNATISFYAASADSAGGFYELDNVSLEVLSSGPLRTDCVDSTVKAPAAGIPDGPEMLVNGNFDLGTTAGWTLFGQITGQVVGGTFEFYRPAAQPNPAGVILQPTGVASSAGDILTARFDLGNSSSVRKRVTVLLHDLDFSDLTACTFWIAPFQPLLTYSMQGFTTKNWNSTTISIYAATPGDETWTRLDNVSLRKTPSVAMPGAACVEPGSGAPAPTTSLFQAGRKNSP